MNDPDYFQQIESELRLATERRAKRPWYRRLTLWQHRPLVLLLASAVVGTPALAASGVLRGSGPGRTCHADSSSATPLTQAITGSLDPALSAILGVFRRPQTRADMLPAKIAGHGPLLGPYFASYDSNLTRLAYAPPDGKLFYLIPARTGRLPLLLDCTPPLSPGQRQKQENAYAHFHPTTQIVVLETATSGQGYGAGASNTNAKSVLAGQALSGTVGPHGGYLWGFVPDGVTSVTVIPRAAPRPIIAKAENNMFFIAARAQSIAAIMGAKKIIWRDAAGHPIKTIDADPCLQLHHAKTRARCERNLGNGPPVPPRPPTTPPAPGP